MHARLGLKSMETTEPVSVIPADIRADIAPGGVPLKYMWVPALGFFLSGFMFFLLAEFLPIEIVVPVSLVPLITTWLIIILNLPERLFRWLRFRQSTKNYLPDAQGGDDSLQGLVGVAPGDEPFVRIGRKWAVVMSLRPKYSWPTMSIDEKDPVVSAVESVLRGGQTTNAHISLYIYVGEDDQREAIEMRVQEIKKRHKKNPGLLEISLARLRHQLEMAPFRPQYYLRVIWMSVAGRNDHKAMRESVDDIVSDLSRANIETSILGYEEVRDLASRQIHPEAYKRFKPVSGTNWLAGYDMEQPEDDVTVVQAIKNRIYGPEKREAAIKQSKTTTIALVRAARRQEHDSTDLTVEAVVGAFGLEKTVAVLDADFSNVGKMSDMFQLEESLLDERDWRKLGAKAAIDLDGISFYGYSKKLRTTSSYAETLLSILNSLGLTRNDMVLVNAGSPMSKEAKAVGEIASAVWIVADDVDAARLMLEQNLDWTGKVFLFVPNIDESMEIHGVVKAYQTGHGQAQQERQGIIRDALLRSIGY